MGKSNRRRFQNEVNAGSMADIAFLLLIFFLVTTQIDTDKGIFIKLPYWEANPPKTDIPSRNVFSIKVNRENELLVEGKVAQVSDLTKEIKHFIMNPFMDQHLASAPNKAVVALQNDRGTSYQTYVSVYNEIKRAYAELWEEESQRRYGKAYMNLPKLAQNEIRKAIPTVISESEPTEY